jgi:ABC-type multidrug transport system fused ATPase/permease subunit
MLVGILAVATLLPLAGPQLVRAFVDDAIAGAPIHRLASLAGVYLLVAIVSQGLAVVTAWQASELAWTATNQLRERLAAHALSLDHHFHSTHTAGEMIERVDGDVVGLTDFLSAFVVQFIGSVLVITGALVLVWREDARIGALLTVLVAAGGVAIGVAQRAVVPRAAALRAASAVIFGNLEERLGAADDIRANGAGAHVVARFHEDAASYYRSDLGWQRSGGAVLAGTQFVFALTSACMIGAGVLLARSGAITVGTVVLLFQYSQLISRPVQQIVAQAKQLQAAGASAARVGDLLAQSPSIVDDRAPIALPPDGALAARLDHVTFSYPSAPPVLHNVTITVPAGRSLALVGPTGSGKTTITRLLMRFYDVGDGTVEVGGVNVRRAPLAQLRTRVRLVTQDVQLFEATLRDNVTLFDDTVPDDAIVAALGEVGLAPWLAELPAGLSTVLGVAGVGVSAGEAQLLALARVFLADPGLIILDEPSSRLDPVSEALVSDALDRLVTGRTAIIIAHRPAALARADDVAVIDSGRVVATGTRDDIARDFAVSFGRLFRAEDAWA